MDFGSEISVSLVKLRSQWIIISVSNTSASWSIILLETHSKRLFWRHINGSSNSGNWWLLDKSCDRLLVLLGLQSRVAAVHTTFLFKI